MTFNDEKFKTLQCKAISAVPNQRRYYSPDGSEIEQVESLKDLGVVVSTNARFEHQIDKIVKKARQMMG